MTNEREERTETLTITVTPSLRQYIRQQAFKEEKTVSSYLNAILIDIFLRRAVGNPTDAVADANGHTARRA